MYNTVNELPVEVRNSFTEEDANSWMRAYNAHYAEWQNGDIQVPPGYVTAETYIRALAWYDSRYLPSSRFVEPVVTTEVVDKQYEVADVDEYLDAAYKALETGGVGIGAHSNKVCFTMWDVFKSEDPDTKKPCIVARVNFYRDTVLYDREWEMFLDGRREWSIGSYTHGEVECDSGRCHTRIHPVQWFELSNVKEGVNPRTYVREYNESAKGVMEMRDYHTDECPLKRKYLDYKHSIEERYDDIFMNMVEGGVGLVHGRDVNRISEDLHNNFQNYDLHNISLKGDDDEGEDCILMVPHPIDTIDDVLHAMIHLMMDEQEAIAGYHTVLESLAKGEWAVEEEWRQTFDLFQEVIADEKNHIGVILKAIQVLAPDTYSSILDGMSEADGELRLKGVECPAGQHSHPGVVGCHDVFRKHDFHHENAPSDVLDLTDEDIDVQEIENMSTDRLRELVLRIAKILTNHTNEEVETFLSTTSGKEFVMMFLELKKRSHEAEVKEMTDNTVEVSEKDAGCGGEESKQTDENTSVEETKKGTDAPDILTLVNSMTATLASLATVVDSMNARLIKIEQATVMEASEDVPQISEEILSAVDDNSATSDDVEEKMEEGAESSDDKVEVETKVESKDETKDESEEKSANEPPAEEKESESKEEDKSEEESEEKTEDETKDESKDDSKEEEKSESETKEESEEKKEDLEEGKKGETEEEVKESEDKKEEETKVVEDSEKSEDAQIPPKEKEMIEEASKSLNTLEDYLDAACKQLSIGAYARPVTSLADVTGTADERLKGDLQVHMPPDVQVFDGTVKEASSDFDPYPFGAYSLSDYLNKMLRRD